MKKYKIICENAIEENDLMYFARFHGRGLYSYDKKNKCTKWLGNFPEQPNNAIRLYESLIKINSKIFAFPSYGESIISIYNIDTNEFETIDIREYIKTNPTNVAYMKFNDCVPYKDYLYIICQSYPAIVKLNIHTYDVEYIDDWVPLVSDKRKKWYFGKGVVREKIVFLPFIEFSAILTMNLETSETQVINLDSELNGFSVLIDGANDDFWLFGAVEPFAININSKGEVLEKIKLFDLPELRENGTVIDNSIKEGNGCFLFPLSIDHIYYFDFISKKCEICDEFEIIVRREYLNDNGRIFSFQTRPHYVYLVEVGSRLWHEIDLRNRSIRTFDVFQYKPFIVRNWQRGIKENEIENLSTFIIILSIKE